MNDTESGSRTIASLKAATGADEGTLAQILEANHIHIQVAASTDDHRLQARVLVNLLHRMFPRISVAGIPVKDLFAPYAGPGIRRIQQTPGPPAGNDVLVVAVGAQSLQRPGWTLYVDNRGWTATLSTTGPCQRKTEPSNPIGAYYAAALGASQVFNQVFRQVLPRAELVTGDYSHDLITHAVNAKPNLLPDPKRLRLQSTALIGVGSIGQALVDLVSSLPEVDGDLTLVDHEGTDAGNESRYVLSFPQNRTKLKVAIAAERLIKRFPLLEVIQNSPLMRHVQIHSSAARRTRDVAEAENPVVYRHWEPELLTYETFRMGVRQTPFNLAVSCVDSAQVRRDIQFGLHRIVVNGWTDTAQGKMNYAVGIHRLDQGACLACIYHPDAWKREPTALDFALRIAGITPERLAEDPGLVNRRFDTQAIQAMAQNQQLPLTEEQIQRLTGKTLAELVHDPECGLARLPGFDREPAAQVLHVPALTACHIVAQIMLLSQGKDSTINGLSVIDALSLPTEYSGGSARPKADGCLCQDPAYVAEYQRLWS